MKFLVRFPLVTAILLLFLGPLHAGDLTVSNGCVLTLSPEIDCPSCEDGIKHLLVAAHGVQSAQIDVLTNKVTIRYDPGRITVKALIGRIAVMGYTAKEIH